MLTEVHLLAVAGAFFGVLGFTPLVRASARRWGMVARPRADRWHTRPTALMGGVAIFAPVMAAELSVAPESRETAAVLAASAFLFLVGLVDDLRSLRPYQKLAGQTAGALAVVACGAILPWTPSGLANLALTLLWLVGITNAVNLLDNMDGLAAGIAAVGCVALGFQFHAAGRPDVVWRLAALAAGLLGFLAYNAHPASIFMGDCGSLFLGFLLAGTAVLYPSPAGGRTRAFLPVLAVPVLTLGIPIFDTLLVVVLRTLAGRPASQGGRDHASHRLVALGLSERHAVWLLYGLAALSGLLAVLVHDLPPGAGVAAVFGFSVVLSLIGVRLARVKVYDEGG